MKQDYSDILELKKPIKPHRQLASSDIPTEEEIQKIEARLEKLQKLGIENNILDMNGRDSGEYEEDTDKLMASILIMQDKEVPEELIKKILDKNKKNKSDSCDTERVTL